MATPIRRPVNVPGPDPDGDPVDLGPLGARRRPAPRRPAPAAGWCGAGARRAGGSSRRSTPQSRSVSSKRHRGGARRRVEPENPHRITTWRSSPPACSSRTRAATCPSAGQLLLPGGRATRRTRSCPGPGSRRADRDPRRRARPAGTDRRGRPPHRRPRIALADRERRAGHRDRHAQRPGGAAHERRLAGAQLPLDQHDVARGQLGRQPSLRAPRSRPRRVTETGLAQADTVEPRPPWVPLPSGHHGRRSVQLPGAHRRCSCSAWSGIAPSVPTSLARAARLRDRQGGRPRRRDDRQQHHRAGLDGRVRRLLTTTRAAATARWPR